MYVNKSMLLYGLVKLEGPYSKGGVSTWSPYARNTHILAPKPMMPITAAGFPDESHYAQRPLRKEEKTPSFRLPRLKRAPRKCFRRNATKPVPADCSNYLIPEIKRSEDLLGLLKQLATFSGQFMVDRPLPNQQANSEPLPPTQSETSTMEES